MHLFMFRNQEDNDVMYLFVFGNEVDNDVMYLFMFGNREARGRVSLVTMVVCD